LLRVRELHGRSGEGRGGHHRTVPDAQPQRLQVSSLARHAQRGGALRDHLQDRRHLRAPGPPHAPLRRRGLAWYLSTVQVRGGGRAAARGRSLARAALGPHGVHPSRLLYLRLHRALGGEGRAVGALLPQQPRLLRDARLSRRALLQPGRGAVPRPGTACARPAQRTRAAHDRIRMEVEMNPATMTTRDPNLPADYSAGLDRLSLAPLWTALHALLPQERVTQAVPHRWRW